jgi:putative tricarboxylic transport membrane protein
MLSGLSELGQAYLSILNVYSLTYGLSGALLGIIVGCLPGLSATLCIALLTTLTIKMAPNDAILILICSYVGTLYGGSRTAILLNIPGTAANAASCADGHALALRGEAGRAIGIATSGAFSGTLFGVLCLAAFTPLLAEVSLSFGAYEFFWLALLGVAMSGSIGGNDPLKGWLMGTLGLFVAQIGQEGLYAHDRFTFGWSQLSGGISLIPALVGAFGFAEVLTTLADPVERKMVEMRDSVLPRFREVFQYWRTVLRSGVIGVLTGLMPGVGEDAGAWMSYAAAKAVSKEREQFGKGSIDGLMAAETGDMSSIPGHIIPCLALGIPGSAPSAVLMAAMIIHGIQPGPMLMIEHPQFIFDVVAMTSLATVSILVFGLFLIKPLLLVLKIKRTVLMPIIFLLCTVGAFAGASRLFDIYCMLAIGIGAFFLRRRGYQMAPFVLGLVLGGLLTRASRRASCCRTAVSSHFSPGNQHRFRDRHHPDPAAVYSCLQGAGRHHHRGHQPADPAACLPAGLNDRSLANADCLVQRGARRHAAGAAMRVRRPSRL